MWESVPGTVWCNGRVTGGAVRGGGSVDARRRRVDIPAFAMLFELIATLCAGFFAGAAAYITLVEHPARLACGTALAATEFVPSYRRATVMQASLAAFGLLASIAAWLQGRGPAVLIGGLLLGLVIPFTLFVILPTNTRLLDPALDRESGEAARLLTAWGRLHAVRTVLSALAFGLLVWHLSRTA
jgi:hypothetical protein